MDSSVDKGDAKYTEIYIIIGMLSYFATSDKP